MNSHRYTHAPAVVRLRSPWRDVRFVLAGVCLVLGIFVLAAYLDDPVDEPESAELAYTRSLAEGRRQMLLAHAGRNREAFQAGMDEAYMRCSAAGVRR